MTQGEDPPPHAEPETDGPSIPRQPGRQGALPPQTSYHDRAESDRRRNNQSANKAFVLGVIKILPPTVAVDDGWTGNAIALGYYPWLRRSAGRAMARAVMQHWTIWKLHDSVGPANEQTILKSGEPRWIIGAREPENVPGVRDYLVAKRDPNDDVSLRVVRVDAEAYEEFRRAGERELRDGFRFRRQYNKEMYDRARKIVRVTARQRGVLRIFDAYNRHGLQPGPDDVVQRRLPAKHLRLVIRYTDRLMDSFGVESNLQKITEALGLEVAYMRLKVTYDAKRWRSPIDSDAAE